MSAKKPLNIGLVGYGFMGRTHSNGYKRVNDEGMETIMKIKLKNQMNKDAGEPHGECE